MSFWEAAERAAEEVKEWPEWHRIGFRLAAQTSEDTEWEQLEKEKAEVLSEIPEVWHKILHKHVINSLNRYADESDLEWFSKEISALRRAVQEFNAAIDETLHFRIKDQII